MSNKNKNAAVRDNRRYKYGGLSIAFTLVFIALILVINVFLRHTEEISFTCFILSCSSYVRF